jgi:hypothetical protein
MQTTKHESRATLKAHAGGVEPPRQSVANPIAHEVYTLAHGQASAK